MAKLVSPILVCRWCLMKLGRHSAHPRSENGAKHYDGQLPSCLILRMIQIQDPLYRAIYTPLAALCYRFVASSFALFTYPRQPEQILSGKVPYHYYSRNVQIVLALCRGQTPMRPDDPSVTDRRWMFIQRCWSPFSEVMRRPSSEEIVAFARDDFFGKGDIHAS